MSRGTNHSSEPLRWQIEQLHAIALLISPSTSNATAPQWQLPRYFIVTSSGSRQAGYLGVDSARNVRLDERRELRQRLLPAEVAHLERDHLGDVLLDDAQIGPADDR